MRNHSNVFILVGGRGRGKTTLIKKLAQRSALPKKLVIDTFPHPAYKEYEKISIANLYSLKQSGMYHFSDAEITVHLPEISLMVYNTMLIFEDCLKYIDANPQPSIRAICLDSKQKGNDIFFLYHSWSQVPPKLTTWADYAITFKTQERIENQKSRLGGIYEQLLPAYELVKKNPDTYYNRAIQLN